MRDDEAMRDMAESVKQYGVLSPAIVRTDDITASGGSAVEDANVANVVFVIEWDDVTE